MKTKDIFKRTLLVLMALLGTITALAYDGTITASAYDFFAENAQGQRIYYNIIDDNSVEVTFKLGWDFGFCYNGYGDIIFRVPLNTMEKLTL